MGEVYDLMPKLHEKFDSETNVERNKKLWMPLLRASLHDYYIKKDQCEWTLTVTCNIDEKVEKICNLMVLNIYKEGPAFTGIVDNEYNHAATVAWEDIINIERADRR